MGEAHVDKPGEISWFSGYGPAAVHGPCPHGGCAHWGRSVIAWGPSLGRYELVQCDQADGCATSCRAWVDGRGRPTTAWLHVDAVDEGLLRRRAATQTE